MKCLKFNGSHKKGTIQTQKTLNRQQHDVLLEILVTSKWLIAVSDTPKCPLCLKITKTDDARLPCTSWKKDFHLMSLGPDFDSSGHCHMCSSNNNMSLDDLSEDEIDLPLKLQEIVNNRGLKLIHQNI